MALKDRLYDVPVLGTALRVQDRYKQDAADQLAASIGFFGFLSLFPLIILAVAIGGFIVRATPGAEVDVAQTIRDTIPGLGGLQGTDAQSLVSDVAANAGAIAGVGLLALLLAGLRVVNTAIVATTRVFRRPEPTGLNGWGRKFGAMALLGVLALGGAVAASATGLPTEVVPAPVRVVVTLAVTFGLDLLLFLVAYRILTAGTGPGWRDLLPGAVLAAVGWTLLKAFGSTWVAAQVSKASDLYGTFAGIIALLLLFYLVGRLYLYGAELNAVVRPAAVGGGGEVSEEVLVPSTPLPPEPEAPRPRRDPFPPRDRDEGVRAAADRAPTHRRASQPPPTDGSTPTGEQRSPTISEDTRQRLAAAEERALAQRDPHYVRRAVAFTLAVATVGGLVYAIRPGPPDDD